MNRNSAAIVLVVALAGIRCGRYESSGGPVPTGTSDTRASSPSPTNAAKPRAVCVIDDSGDMRGSDGVAITPEGDAPVLRYVLPTLGCSECTLWSMFNAADLKQTYPSCADVKFGTLTATSPLSTTLEEASAAANSEDVNLFFVTNGLDWIVAGKPYRTEVNAGRMLERWIHAKNTNDLIVGSFVDHMNGSGARAIMILGFVSSSYEPGTVSDSLPRVYNFAYERLADPSRCFEGGLAVRPVAELYDRGHMHTQTGFDEDGVATITEPWVERLMATDVDVNLTPCSKKYDGFGYEVSVDGGAYVAADCQTAEMSDRCRIPLLHQQQGLSHSVRIRPVMRLTPSVGALVRSPSHALRISVASANQALTREYPIVVDRAGARPVRELRFSAQESVRR